MAIIRKAETVKKYTYIPNEVILDESLSFEAKGIYTYLLTFDGEKVDVAEIIRQRPDEEVAAMKALEELERRGLISLNPDWKGAK